MREVVALSFKMHDAARLAAANLPAGLSGHAAVIRVVVIQEITFVEQSDFAHGFRTNHGTRKTHPIVFVRTVRRRELKIVP